MGSSKSKARAQAQQRARAQAKKATARTTPGVRATPTSTATSRTTRPVATATLKPSAAAEAPFEPDSPSGPPTWLPVTTFVLAIIGLGVSIYETYAHYNGNKLAGCPIGKGTFNCTAVITSSQAMVFDVLPVAVLGLAFYVVAVPLFSPWAWRFTQLRVGPLRVTQRTVGWLRLVSVIVGMGFVMYLIYAEVAQIKQVCEYCTGVHVVTFLLFCLTVVAAALWGLGEKRSTDA